MQQKYKSRYEKICALVPGFDQFDLVQFLQTLLLIYSRFFNLELDTNQQATIVPYADMLNHNNSKANAGYDYSDRHKGFLLVANKDIAKGEELFI
jgi:hypothetical protein